MPDNVPPSPRTPGSKQKRLGLGGWLLLLILGAATAFVLIWAIQVFLPYVPKPKAISRSPVPRVSVYLVVSPPKVRKVVLAGRVVKPGPVWFKSPVAGKVFALIAPTNKVLAQGERVAELKNPALDAQRLRLQDALAEAQDAVLDAAQNKTGSVQQAQKAYDALESQMDTLKAQMEALHVKLPWRGRLLKYEVAPGDQVEAGTPLATVETLRNLDVVMTLPIALLVSLEEKQSLDVLAKTRWGQLKTRGRVTAIVIPDDPIETEGSLRIGLSANREVPLRQNQTVDVVFWLPTHGHYWVPKACLKTQDDKPVVGVIRPRGKHALVEVRPVVTGLESDDMVEIVSGVIQGEQLVREGLSSLQAGKLVEPVNGITDTGAFSPKNLLN